MPETDTVASPPAEPAVDPISNMTVAQEAALLSGVDPTTLSIESTPGGSQSPNPEAETNPEATNTPANTSPDQGQDVDDDALAARLGAEETAEEKLARIERDHKGQSEAARRYAAQVKAMSASLKEQGLEPQFSEKGEFEGYVQAKGAKSKAVVGKAPKYESLTQDEQDLFQTDPQEAIDLVMDRIKEGITVALPTKERGSEPLTEERANTAIEHVQSAQDLDGEARNPGFEKNLPFIRKNLLNGPGVPSQLQDMYRAAPEFTLSLLNSKVQHERQILKDRAAGAKKSVATNEPDLGPGEGGGSPSLGTGSVADEIGKAIASAGPVY